MREKALEELRLLHRVRHCDRLVRLLAIRVPLPEGAQKEKGAAAVMPTAGAAGGSGTPQQGSSPGMIGTPGGGRLGGWGGGAANAPAGPRRGTPSRGGPSPPSPGLLAFPLNGLDASHAGGHAAAQDLGLPPSLILEFMAGGTLQQRIKDRDEALLAWGAGGRRIALDVAEGLLYLHTRRPCIVHRDLRSVNVLLTATGRAKIADLGACPWLRAPWRRPLSHWFFAHLTLVAGDWV